MSRTIHVSPDLHLFRSSGSVRLGSGGSTGRFPVVHADRTDQGQSEMRLKLWRNPPIVGNGPAFPQQTMGPNGGEALDGSGFRHSTRPSTNALPSCAGC